LTGTAVGWAHRAVIGLPQIRFDQMHPSQPSLVLVASTGLRVGDDAVIAYKKKFQKTRGLGKYEEKFFKKGQPKKTETYDVEN